MLQALFERDIAPDLVLGTSIGALNGALVARDPSLAVIERLTDLWQTVATSRDGPACSGIYSYSATATRLGERCFAGPLWVSSSAWRRLQACLQQCPARRR